MEAELLDDISGSFCLGALALKFLLGHDHVTRRARRKSRADLALVSAAPRDCPGRGKMERAVSLVSAHPGHPSVALDILLREVSRGMT